MKKGFLNLFSIVGGLALIVSCDAEYSSVGSDLVGDNHFNFELNDEIDIKAYSQYTGPVQTNNMPISSFGVYNDLFFGETRSSFVTQLQLPTSAPDFGTNIDIQATDSVYLYMPYFSTIDVAATGNEANTYLLDSIYGDVDTVLNLKVVENKYTINQFDPTDNNQSVQKYYSNQESLITGVSTGPTLNNDTDTAQNTNFKVLSTEIIKYKTNAAGAYLDSEGAITTNPENYVVKERMKPGVYVNLDKTFFKTKVLQATAAQLSNSNNFNNHFKGLFIQANLVSGSGIMPHFNLADAEIVIQYHSLLDGETEKRQTKLNLSGTRINFYENTTSTLYQNGMAAQDPVLGSEKLYLKGNGGSHAIIELFGEDADNNGTADQIEDLRAQNILINDATISFFIARSDLNGASEAKRIYLYDATNQTPIIDYTADSSTGTTYNVKSVFGGVLILNSDEEGVYYTIRISQHLNRVLNGTNSATNKNVKLGLSVTDNAANSLMSELLTPVNPLITKTPYSSVFSPRGTILYGNTSTDADKRLKVKLYYTKEN